MLSGIEGLDSSSTHVITLSNCIADSNAVGFNMNYVQNFQIENCEVKFSVPDGSVGSAGIHIRNSVGSISDTQVHSNHANYPGIYSENSAVSASFLTLTNNSAIYGGAGGWYSYHSALSLTNMSISNHDVGGVSFVGGTLNMTNCTITNNRGPVYGGIQLLGVIGHLSSVVISNNIATGPNSTGGGMHLASAAVINIDFSTFSTNQAYNGGGVWMLDSSINTIITSFESNQAVEKGGALYAEGSEVQLQGSTFTDNFLTSPTSEGGAFHSFNSYASIFSNHFINNTCALNGGAVYLVYGTFHLNTPNYVRWSTFTNNRASHGGAVYMENDNGTRIWTNHFLENEAKIGGGMNLQNCTSSIMEADVSIYNKIK